MAEYTFQLRGWKALVALAAVAVFFGGRTYLRVRPVDDAMREAVKARLLNEYSGRGPKDVARILAEAREGKPVEQLQPVVQRNVEFHVDRGARENGRNVYSGASRADSGWRSAAGLVEQETEGVTKRIVQRPSRSQRCATAPSAASPAPAGSAKTPSSVLPIRHVEGLLGSHRPPGAYGTLLKTGMRIAGTPVTELPLASKPFLTAASNPNTRAQARVGPSTIFGNAVST